MKVNLRTRRVLAYRRKRAALEAQGYELVRDALGVGQRDRWRESICAVECLPDSLDIMVKTDRGAAYEARKAEDAALNK